MVAVTNGRTMRTNVWTMLELQRNFIIEQFTLFRGYEIRCCDIMQRGDLFFVWSGDIGEIQVSPGEILAFVLP